MSFHRWLQKAFGSPKARRSASRWRPNALRGAFEALENRFALATLTVSDATLIEGDAGTTSAVVTVRLTGSANPNVSVRYSTASGTARAGSDYQAVSGTLTFNKGETSKSILVPVIGDRLHEPNEAFFVDLYNAKRATITDGRGVVTITDDDPNLTINDVTVTEGNSGETIASFLVTLSPAPIRSVTVNYATADGTALAGSDYQAATGMLTFAPGQASQTITVLVNGDWLGEPSEAFFVNLSSPSGAVTADGQGVATIIDDEPLIAVSSASVTEGNEGMAEITFDVSLSSSTIVPVTVHYATVDHTAVAGSDYRAASGTLTFVPGETHQTVTVLVSGDRLSESSEFFELNLTSADNAVIDGDQGLGTILEDEPFAEITYGVSLIEGDAGTTAFNFEVILWPAASDIVLVEYSTHDISTTAGIDYEAASGTLTFAPGEGSRTITVLIHGDEALEYHEQFVVGLSSNAEGYGWILNDDGPLVSISDSTVYEGDYASTFIYFEVRLSVPATETVTVDFTTINGRASANWDYVPATGTLTFAPGETSKWIGVEVLGDTFSEFDEEFYVVLSNCSINTLIERTWGTGTIVDNDYSEWF